jgi:hypothetical protein
MRSRTTRFLLFVILAAQTSACMLHSTTVAQAPHVRADVRASSSPVASIPPSTAPPAPAPPVKVTPRSALPHRASRGARSLSGKPMPTGNLPGWKQFLAQDFRGRSLPAGWGTYVGQPGGNQHGWWSPAEVAVRDGRLVLSGGWRAGRFTTGGVMSWAGRSTYGKYEVRFRAPKAYGVKYALLLWPSNGGWPSTGEIDFAEDGGDGARRGTTGTVHHGADNRQVHRMLSADFSTWQTAGVEWTPGKVVYTLNGKPWGSVVSPDVPSGPMDLVLQLEAGAGDEWSAAPDARTPAHVALEVDWAVGYRRA